MAEPARGIHTRRASGSRATACRSATASSARLPASGRPLMSAVVQVPRATEPARLDEMVGRLQAGAKTWAALPLAEKIAVAERMKDGFMKVVDRLVDASCSAKGITKGT